MLNLADDEADEDELLTLKKQLGQFTSSIQMSSPYSMVELESLYDVGVHLYQKGKWEDASLFFGMINLLDPLNPLFLTAQGKCLKSMGAFQNAYEVFYLAWKIDNNMPAPALHAAECLMLSNRKDDAVSLINALLAMPSMSGQNLELKEKAEAWIKLLEAGEMHGKA